MLDIVSHACVFLLLAVATLLALRLREEWRTSHRFRVVTATGFGGALFLLSSVGLGYWNLAFQYREATALLQTAQDHFEQNRAYYETQRIVGILQLLGVPFLTVAFWLSLAAALSPATDESAKARAVALFTGIGVLAEAMLLSQRALAEWLNNIQTYRHDALILNLLLLAATITSVHFLSLRAHWKSKQGAKTFTMAPALATAVIFILLYFNALLHGLGFLRDDGVFILLAFFISPFIALSSIAATYFDFKKFKADGPLKIFWRVQLGISALYTTAVFYFWATFSM